ncbi:hypothetical protein SEA_LIBERTYBELL_51 [Streptomyces phage LibertyBell]|nr:hypothetical protein SEA_LIBERTYBELL_51 [Streptomyces phage LibertyBell]
MRIYFSGLRTWVIRPITVFSVKGGVMTEDGILGWQVGPLRIIFWDRMK